MNGDSKNNDTQTAPEDQKSENGQQSNGQTGGQTDPRLKEFHQNLLGIQSRTDISGIPEDYGEFENAFLDFGWRKQFFDFLQHNQNQGNLSGIPQDFERFQQAFIPSERGDLGPAPDAPGTGPPPTGSDLPDELQQMDLPVQSAAEQSADSTQELENLTDLETWQASHADRAAQALTDYGESDVYEIRRERRIESAREKESSTIQEIRELTEQAEQAKQSGEYGEPFFTRTGSLEVPADPELQHKLLKAQQRLESIRDMKNQLLGQKERDFQETFSPSERLGFKWEAGKKQIKSARAGQKLVGKAETLELMNVIDRQGDPTEHSFAVSLAGLPPHLQAYKNADPERRKKMKAALVGNMADNVQEMMDLQKSMSEIPQNPYAAELIEAETANEAFDTFQQSPIDIISTLGITSLPFSAASIVGGVLGGLVAGPAGAGAGAGIGSGQMEYMAGLTEGIMREVQELPGYSFEDIKAELEDRGINTRDITPETLFGGQHSHYLKDLIATESGQQSMLRRRIMKVLDDPEAMDRVKKFALKRGVSIGVMDAAGTFVPVKGLTGTLMKNLRTGSKAAKTVARTGIAGTVALGITVDAMAGGVGEMLAQMVSTGDLQPGEISAELIGELMSALPAPNSLCLRVKGRRLKLPVLRPVRL